MTVRRFARYQSDSGLIATYVHGVRIGVMVEVEGGSLELGKDIAMHVAASNPLCVSEADVPQSMQDKEREIYMAQARDSGKPLNIIEKMVDGRLRKWLAEITLHGQPFVKDPDLTVAKLVQKAGARVVRFQRFEVGEGIEKRSENFAEEVMAQARGA
jgi:elongation factor Ts